MIMKKQFFLALAVAGALASCSNEEVLSTVEDMQPKPKAIGFNGFVNKSTRASSNNITTLQTPASEGGGFYVYGFMAPTNTTAETVTTIFDHVLVSYDNSSSWTYSGTRYWTEGNSYGFTAIYPNPASETSNYLTFTPTTTYKSDGTYDQGGEIKFNNSSANAEVDLIADFQNVASVVPTSQGIVNFTFNHYLSRIRFKFENGFSNNTIKVSGLSLGNMDSEATCNTATDISNVTWTKTESNTLFSKTFTFSSNNPIEVSGSNISVYNFAIPQTAKQHTASFTVELYTSGVHTGTYYFNNIQLPAINMQPGYSYQYIAKIDASNINGGNTLKPIEFGVISVNSWENFQDVNIWSN